MRQGLSRMAVVEAAAAIADKQGFEQVTLASVAQQLGIRTPSLYNHIDGLQGLRKELALLSIRRLTERMSEAAIGKAGESALHSIGEAYVLFAQDHPGLYEVIFRPPDPLDPDIQSAVNDILNLLFRVLEPFQLTDDELIHTVRGLRSLVHGFASLVFHQGFKMEIDMKESFKFILNTYLNGLKTRV